MRNRKKGYKIFITVLALVLAFLAAGLGVALTGELELRWQRFLVNWVFMMLPMSVLWLVIELWRSHSS